VEIEERLKSNEKCHVCGYPMKYALKAEKMWCENERCQIRNVLFTVPYEDRGDP
jgi:hypothetical protein